jgi:hypothetical protein
MITKCMSAPHRIRCYWCFDLLDASICTAESSSSGHRPIAIKPLWYLKTAKHDCLGATRDYL